MRLFPGEMNGGMYIHKYRARSPTTGTKNTGSARYVAVYVPVS